VRRLDRGWRRALAFAAALFVLSAGVAMAGGAVWARDFESPRVTVLGAGNRLSVLVTAGPSRLLIATGDDPGAFGNALADARPPMARRLDVVLLAGRATDLAVAAEASADSHARYVATIGPLPDSAATDAMGAETLPVIDAPRRIRLSDEVDVTVEVAVVPGEDADEPPIVAWRAVVRRGATTVVVLSDGRDAGRFGSLGPVAAVVLVGEHPAEAVDHVATGALVVNSDTVEGRELRGDIGTRLNGSMWAVRVFPGEAVRLEFVDGGLRLPDEVTQAIGPTPASDR